MSQASQKSKYAADAESYEYPGSLSWNVPRFSIPSILGPMPTLYEWWMYVGHLKDSENKEYTVFTLCGKFTAAKLSDSLPIPLDFGFQLLAIGEFGQNGASYRSDIVGPGLQSGEIGQKTFKRGCYGIGDNANATTEYTYIGQNNKYPADTCVGMIGSRYNIKATMIGSSIEDESTANKKVNLGLNLYVEDERGVVLECQNGHIGDTFEVNQPRLKIIDSSANGNKSLKSVLIIDSSVKDIVSGTLILDRQGVLLLGSGGKQTVNSLLDDAKEAKEADGSDEEKKKQIEYLEKNGKDMVSKIKDIVAKRKMFMNAVNSVRNLVIPSKSSASIAVARAQTSASDAVTESDKKDSFYIGHWGVLNLVDGTSFSFAQVWSEASPNQWQACTNTGNPPVMSFAVKYNARKINDPAWMFQGNGGSYLNGYPNNGTIDFDVNILNPIDPSQSPHWTGPAKPNKDGKSVTYTYATAWTVSLNGFWKFPVLYLFAQNPKCESWPNTWEGSVKIYSSCKQEDKYFQGYGWFEQMGMPSD